MEKYTMDNIDTLLDSLERYPSPMTKIRHIISEVEVADLSELLKNKKVFGLVGSIYEKYASDIKIGLIDRHIKDEDIISLVEAYCIKENIEINYNINLDETDELPLDDNFKVYMTEISKIPMLTPEEEKKVVSMLPSKEAKEKLITANLRLVIWVVTKKIGNTRDMELMDLIQAGNEGLMKAADRFDPKKGTKFSTYSVWWIRQSAVRAVHADHKFLNMPVNYSQLFEKVKSVYTKYLNLGLTTLEADKLTCEELDITPKELYEMQKIQYKNNGVSLNEGINEDEDEIGDFVPSDMEAPDKAAISSELRMALYKGLEILNEREKKVIILRYGLEDGNAMRLEAVGKVFGVTRERIRQIEAVALRKLRNPKISKAYADWAEEPGKFKNYSQYQNGYQFKKHL